VIKHEGALWKGTIEMADDEQNNNKRLVFVKIVKGNTRNQKESKNIIHGK